VVDVLRRLNLPLIAVFALGIAAVAATVEAPTKRAEGPHESPLLPRRELLNVLGASHKQLIADYYWIRSTNAAGMARTAEDYKDLALYGQLITDLDPGFAYVYQFIGALVPYNFGREKWVNTRESTDLLEKGFKYFPHVQTIRILLAYNLTYFHFEHERAAKLLSDGARRPDAPPWMGQLATRLYAMAGRTDAGMAFAESILATANDPETKATFEHRIKELKAEKVLQDVDAAIAKFLAREGRGPKDVGELIAKGDLPGIPEDPLGGWVIIGPDGRAASTAMQRRLEIFDPRKELDEE
jgi:hypothetical protein